MADRRVRGLMTAESGIKIQQKVEQVRAMGYFHNFEWGCKSGVHGGWAILEAESQAQASLAGTQQSTRA